MTQASSPPSPAPSERQAWMRTLSLASPLALESAVREAEMTHGDALPQATPLRQPEVGMVLVRARAGGTGDRFNLGEMTMTRCAVRLDGPPAVIGFAHIAGRNHRHAELAALCDALLQTESWQPIIRDCVLAPLDAARQALTDQRCQRAAETKVDFFTLVRGES